MAYIVNQIDTIVNDAVSDALGLASTAAAETLTTSDYVSFGEQLSAANAYEGFFGSLVNRLVKTVFFVRSYEGSSRRILRDEHAYGAFVQKVVYEMPDAVENPAWDIPTSGGAYTQASPYDVSTTLTVSASVYGGQGTWAVEVVRPMVQVKTAFVGPAEMAAFIDGIYVTIENAIKLQEEAVEASAANTAIASAVNGGLVRNLVTEYNTIHSLTGTAALTATTALHDADFLAYAAMEINRLVPRFAKMSTMFNVRGHETFTDKDYLVVELHSAFDAALTTYLKANTFHEELIKLPGYATIPYWQYGGVKGGGANDLAQTMKIDVINDAFVSSGNATGTISQGNIICFMHDVENVAAYFGERRSWEHYNPRSDVMVHGETGRKGFAVDEHANAMVFLLA